MSDPIVIVGGGLAAGTAATTLRELGYDGDLVLFADEAHLPYERPPLSKDLLRGEKEPESTYVQPAEWYADHDVVVRTGHPVIGLDLENDVVHTDVGETPFASLLLATGARARTLPIEPTHAVEVHYLRSLDDAERLRDRLGEGHRLLVVGAGWIGMEVAASARQLGTAVTVVDPAEQPLMAVLGPEIGRRFAAVHRDHGVDLRTGTALDHLEHDVAVLTDGTTVVVDTVLVGVGAVPNDDLARAAGLGVDNGILVDAGLRTSHRHVFAAGDVANALHPVLGERIRVEHWQNAIGQGRAAAHALLGEPVSYDELPYFFTDQYDLGMEYFGHPGAAGFDEVRIEPGPSDDAFAAYWSREGRLVAAMHVNEWDRSEELRKRVQEGR
ncbi:MAG TPA: FAD-dependent oxidoreductase [Marmoricola sp.]|nr:FAD-dependent oxidoreductase [Marmoricola sp.]